MRELCCDMNTCYGKRGMSILASQYISYPAMTRLGRTFRLRGAVPACLGFDNLFKITVPIGHLGDVYWGADLIEARRSDHFVNFHHISTEATDGDIKVDSADLSKSFAPKI